MPRVAILGGAYTDDSLIADAQRAVNIYPQFNPERAQAPVNVTHFPRPGRTLLGTPPALGRGRCLYGATNGDLYAVIDQSVYYIDQDFKFTFLGLLSVIVENTVYMADNGFSAIVVDVFISGYEIIFPISGSSRGFNQISDPNFIGASQVDYIDSF